MLKLDICLPGMCAYPQTQLGRGPFYPEPGRTEYAAPEGLSGPDVSRAEFREQGVRPPAGSLPAPQPFVG